MAGPLQVQDEGILALELREIDEPNRDAPAGDLDSLQAIEVQDRGQHRQPWWDGNG